MSYCYVFDLELVADDVALDFNFSSLSVSNSLTSFRSRSRSCSSRSKRTLLETVSSRTFAEQLTGVDAVSSFFCFLIFLRVQIHGIHYLYGKFMD